MNHAERAILAIFREFETEPYRMLQFPSFMGGLEQYNLSSADFFEAMRALIAAGLVEERRSVPGAYFLTPAGYEASLTV